MPLRKGVGPLRLLIFGKFFQPKMLDPILGSWKDNVIGIEFQKMDQLNHKFPYGYKY